MAKSTPAQFEFVGDLDDLPDAAFDALAALLLSVAEPDALDTDERQVCQEDTRS